MYEGLKFQRGNCGVSIMRSGKAFLTHQLSCQIPLYGLLFSWKTYSQYPSTTTTTTTFICTFGRNRFKYKSSFLRGWLQAIGSLQDLFPWQDPPLNLRPGTLWVPEMKRVSDLKLGQLFNLMVGRSHNQVLQRAYCYPLVYTVIFLLKLAWNPAKHRDDACHTSYPAHQSWWIWILQFPYSWHVLKNLWLY